MKLLATGMLLMICVMAMGQSSLHAKDKKKLTSYPYVYIDTESKYSSSAGPSVIIQNSLPKGGGYKDSAGKQFGAGVFWTRIINETATPLELTIHFPADPFDGRAKTKIFLPPDTMTLSKETLYGYGIEDLRPFLDANLDTSTSLQRTIHSKEACMFYVVVIFGEAVNAARAEFVLKGQELFYTIRGITPQLNAALIPCGKIVFKE